MRASTRTRFETCCGRAAARIEELQERRPTIDLTEDAAELAAHRITEADHLAAGRIAYAERQVEEMLAEAEADARSRAGAVLSEAQRRLEPHARRRA